MAKQEKISKSGFVIKLSSETFLKLSEEDQLKQNKESLSEPPEEETITKELKQTEPEQSSPKSKQVLCIDSSTELQSEDNSLKKDSLNDIQTVKDLRKSDDGPEGKNSFWGEYAAFVTYEGQNAIYTDPSNQQKYTWNNSTSAWDPVGDPAEVPGRVYSYENDTHVYTDQDGSKFFWDLEKKAWIPKVDDEFLAMYQMSYGFIDNTSKEDEPKNKEKIMNTKTTDTTQAGVKRKNDPQWFEPDDNKNTKVYVSNLPLEMTEEEFVDFMQKCGLVERDPSTQKMKVKLYTDKEQKCFKGDALCTYIKIESVDLALKLLDGCDFKGNKVKVERAHFQMKGDYNPALKPKKKKKKELDKIKKMQQKLFDWRPEKFLGERSKHERVVIVKNLFHPTDFDKEVQLILDYQQDLREECSKSGEVRKVVIYDGHPEGVAQITMKEPEQADAVIELINGRWFGKRQITAEMWDGRTKYRIAETDADINKRIDKWGKFLEGKEEEDKGVVKETDKSSTENIVEVKITDKLSTEDVIVAKDVDQTNTEHIVAVIDSEKSSTDNNVTVKDTDISST